MKYSLKNIGSILTLILMLSFVACQVGEDGPSDTDDTDDADGSKTTSYYETNQWLEAQMRAWYLWNDEIPASSNLNFSSNPTTFFASMLCDKDGFELNGVFYHFSRITQKSTSTYASFEGNYYGFEYGLARIVGENTNVNYYALIVTYVLPNSAASKAGLKRGDIITTSDGDFITDSNVDSFNSGGARTLGIDTLDKKINTLVTYKTLQLPASSNIEDNPVFLDTIYQNVGDKTVGYFVYNHFDYAKNDASSHDYDRDMCNVFQKFKAAGVDELILDLRYNSGGYISCCKLLSTMIAPSSALNEDMLMLKYNSQQEKYYNSTEKFDKNYMEQFGGVNLNLKRLYVLTSFNTASSSELVINVLRPYMDVVLVGGTTLGKNVGSIEINVDKYNWYINPIVSKLYNCLGESDYDDGFTPNVSVGEYDEGISLYPLGDRREVMLKTALNEITKSRANIDNNRLKSISAPSCLEFIGSSLDKKSPRAIIEL